MDELEKILEQLKSLKEASVEEVQSVYKRYETMGASGTEPASKEVFLQQQNLSADVLSCDLTEKDIQGLFEEHGMKYDERFKDRVKIYRASDETVDSAGDIIRQTGWNFSRFKTNPVFAYCHDYYVLPIGSAIKWQVKDGALFIHEVFALPEANPWADMCFQMVNAGMFKGCSVGFIPQKVMRIEDESERAKLGLGRWGVIFEKQTLLENSACTLGCNPNALVQDEIAKALQGKIIAKDSLMRIVKDDGQFKAPESLKISIDRAFTLCQTKKVFEMVPIKSVPETPETKTEPTEDPVILALKDFRGSVIDKIVDINSQLTAIKTDIAQLRTDDKGAGGSGGNKPDTVPDTDLAKAYFELDEMIRN